MAKMKLMIIAMVLVSLFALSMASVSAATLFSDNFNDDNFNGWNASRTTGSPSNHYGTENTTRNYDGTFYAWVEDDSSMYTLINSTGYNNISLSYCSRTYGSSGSDRLRVGWKTGAYSSVWGNWNELEARLNDTWACKSFSLPSGANNGSFLVSFFLDDGNNNIGYFDNVVVTGDLISVAPVTCASFTYSAWSECNSSSLQSRTITSSSPTGCTGGSPEALVQSCQYEPPQPDCVQNWSVGEWGQCADGTQTRTVIDLNQCDNSTGMPETTQSCTSVILPSCSIDYLRVIGSSTIYNLTANPFLSSVGNFFVYGSAFTNNASCAMNWVGYNRTSPNYEYESWRNADNQGVWATWRTNQNDLSFVEGNHTICCSPESRSCVGNNCQTFTGLPSCKTFCIDTQAPYVSVDDISVGCAQQEANYWNDSSFTWSWSAEDSGCAGIKEYNITLYANGSEVDSAVTTETSWTYDSLIDGTVYNISVSAIDNAGNVGIAVSDSIIVDLTDPTVEMWTVPSGFEGYWFGNDFIVSEQDSDANLLSCEYMIGDSSWSSVACGGNVSVDVSQYCQDGSVCPLTVSKQVTDKACRVGSDGVKVGIDLEDSTTIKLVGDPKYEGRQWMQWLVHWFVRADTGFSFEASDGDGSGVAGTYYNITYQNGTVVQGTIEGTSFNLPDVDGIYYVTYWSVDNVGNVEAFNYETDKLDNLAPVTTKTIGQPQYSSDGKLWVTSATNFTFSCNDSEVGCDYTDYIIGYVVNGEAQMGDSKFGSMFNLDGKDGEYYVEYYSYDLLGNQEVTKNETDWLDNTPPEIVIHNPTFLEAESIEDCSMDVLVTSTDFGSGVNASSLMAYVKLENGTIVAQKSLGLVSPAAYEAVLNIQGLSSGSYTLEVVAKDNLGNTQSVTRPIYLEDGIFVEYLDPSTCSVDAEDGNCLLTFHACVRDSSSISMRMDKLRRTQNPEGNGLISPLQVNATIHKDARDALVGLREWNGEGYTIIPENDDYLDLSSTACQNVNGRVTFDLTMDFSAEDIETLGTGSFDIDYLLNAYECEAV